MLGRAVVVRLINESSKRRETENAEKYMVLNM
jgi:hypothetical protein